MNHTGLLVLAVAGAAAMLLPSGWVLPPVVLICLLVVIALAAFATGRFLAYRYAYGVCAFCIGAAVSCWQIDTALKHRVPQQWFGEDVTLQVHIVSVTNELPKRQILIAETVQAPAQIKARRWRINWYGPPISSSGEHLPVRVGDTWQLTIRVRGLTGTGNPGGFDVAAWYLRTHIDGTGYVRKSPAPMRLSNTPSVSVNSWRAELSEQIKALKNDDPHDAVVVALTLGFRDGIADPFRELLVTTGTAHLLAISGMHIGLVSLAAFWLLRYVWAFSPARLKLHVSRTTFAGVFSVVVAFLYAVLAGLSPPTIRAVIMCAMVFFIHWRRRSVSPWWPFSLALAVVVFSDVLHLLSVGVWLSFGTVSLIIFLNRRPQFSNHRFGQLYKAVSVSRLHFVLGICLLPITGWFFSTGSMVSPLANLLAVPWVTLAVVPLSLLTLLLTQVSDYLATRTLALVNWAISMLEHWLVFCANLPFAGVTVVVPSMTTFLLALLGVVVFCLPGALRLRPYALALCFPVVVWSMGERKVDGLELHVLDVGQGHASLLLTENHVVLIDTGGSIGGDRTHWDATIYPALRHLGRRKISHVVISHSDDDHASGAHALAQQFPDANFWLGGVTVIEELASAKRCEAGMSWVVDGTHFSFLHPAKPDVDSTLVGQNVDDNDQSCVLLVQLGRSTLLFPGDIEKRAEQRLMRRMLTPTDVSTPVSTIELPHAPTDRATQAPSQASGLTPGLALGQPLTIMIAPHHGSRTSSTQEFVDAWQPQHVVYAAGYRNRSGFPHDDVLMRYKIRGSEEYVTGLDGALEFRLGPDGLHQPPIRYWGTNRRLWHRARRW